MKIRSVNILVNISQIYLEKVFLNICKEGELTELCEAVPYAGYLLAIFSSVNTTTINYIFIAHPYERKSILRSTTDYFHDRKSNDL